MEEKGVFIDVKDDGLYLVLDNKVYKDPGLTKNPTLMFDGTGAEDIDLEALKDAFKSNEELVEIKVSEKTKFAVRNETVEVTITKDAMEASVAFIQGHPWFGDMLSGLDIINRLKDSNVTYGVLTEVIDTMQTSRSFSSKSVVVAVGRPPVNGENGYLKYHFDTSGQGNKPKILDNGSVDYKNVDGILKASKTMCW